MSFLLKVAAVADLVNSSRSTDEEQKNKFLTYMGLRPKVDYTKLEMGDETAPSVQKTASLFGKWAQVYAANSGIDARATPYSGNNPGKISRPETIGNTTKSMAKEEQKLIKPPDVTGMPDLGATGSFAGSLLTMSPSVNSSYGTNPGANESLPGGNQPTPQAIQPTPSKNMPVR
jgi:hypothetical protein